MTTEEVARIRALQRSLKRDGALRVLQRVLTAHDLHIILAAAGEHAAAETRGGYVLTPKEEQKRSIKKRKT
jgi:hypothetical protein